ncbi:hypothetical protein DVH05_017826 [Phytophthora capsici]|nr:hypothetical protein DVH05_017826 [Phytophthora capsici]
MGELFKLLNTAHMVEMAKWKQEWEEDRKHIYLPANDRVPGQRPDLGIHTQGGTGYD